METEFKDSEKTAKAIKTEEWKEYLKVYFNSTTDLVTARTTIKELDSIKEKREFDLIFTQRYLIDKELEPLNGIELEIKEKIKLPITFAEDCKEEADSQDWG